MTIEETAREYALHRVQRLWNEVTPSGKAGVKRIAIDESPYPHQERRACVDAFMAGYRLALKRGKNSRKRKKA